MDNLAFGLQVTVVGMGIVFGMLAVLWLLLTLVLRFEQRGQALAPAAAPTEGVAGAAAPGMPRAPAPDATAPAPAGPVRLVGAPADLDPRLVAAVGVAVLRHADARRRQAAPAMRSYWPGSLLFASRWVAAGRMRQGQIWRRRAR